jgi:Ca2+-binding RTX toxin-like protein
VLRQQPLASIKMLTILGAANKSDLVRVDFRAGGSFVLAEGIVLGGGTGTQADTLLLRGTDGSDRFEIGNGYAALSGLLVAFGGIEQLTLDGGAGDDTYQVSDLSAMTTIVDTKGTDALDFGKATVGITIDLSKISGQAQRVFASDSNTLALKSTIENLIATEAADWIKGNSAENRIDGRSGNDTIYGGAGNDTVYGGAGDDWLYGEAGNDSLYGGPGNNVLLGGAGNDLLDVSLGVSGGSTGRNALIGGAGLDTLRGGLGEEILIGGTTAYDNKAAALAVVMKVWTSTNVFQARCSNLETGIKDPKTGLVQMVRKTTSNPKGTVIDDRVKDVLYGSAGSDWFFDFAKDETDRGSNDH